MNVVIEKIELTNFKGCRNATYEFSEKSNSILGQNGAGKSTIATAWYWVFANCDTDLHNNPVIFPLDVEECTPTVRIWLNCNEKSVEVVKMQKRTVKKSKTGGADTVSLSNSYEVNSVEYGERDFKKKMREYGFDFDLFLPLSHPDVFTSRKSADMREVLFGMASEKSDYEIAVDMDGLKYDYNLLTKEEKEKTSFEEFIEEEISNSGTCEVGKLLKNYTADEVKAMQNATLRKIREEYGKDGEILRAKIEGMEQSKTDIDVAELELQKNALNEQISENKTKQEDISKEFEEQQRASDGVIELQFELNDLQRKANEELIRKKRESNEFISKFEEKISDCERGIREADGTIKKAEWNISDLEKEIEEWREKYTAENEREFDENRLICPYCKQEYQEEKKDELRADFARHKSEELKRITKRGNECKKAIDGNKDWIKKLKEQREKYVSDKEKLQEQFEPIKRVADSFPESIDISDRPKAQEIQKQIAEKEAAMNKGNSAEEVRQQVKDEGEDLQSQLTEVEKQLALAQKNVEIDEQIAALRKKQGEYEQNKANAEKILYQLDLVSRKKNTLLQDDVNSHFELVDFKLFDWLKNGEYKEVCVPQFKGKDMGVSTNTGLEILMKLDVIKGLQRHYDMFLPIFVDGAEALDRNSIEKIEMDCQCIFLSVVDEKELKIVTE